MYVPTCTCKCLHLHVGTCMCKHMPAPTCGCIHMHEHMRVHVHVQTHGCVCASTCVQAHICLHAHIHAHTCEHTQGCTHICGLSMYDPPSPPLPQSGAQQAAPHLGGGVWGGGQAQGASAPSKHMMIGVDMMMMCDNISLSLDMITHHHHITPHHHKTLAQSGPIFRPSGPQLCTARASPHVYTCTRVHVCTRSISIEHLTTCL